MPDEFRKYLLLGLIGSSAVLYFPVFRPGFDALSLAQYLGFFGMQLIWWQVILGSRTVSRYISRDLFFVKNVHKFLGKYGFILVMLHPVILLQTYGIELLLPNFNFSDQFVLGTTVGKIGISFLVLTWFASVFIRAKISWRNWKRIHLVPYIALPLLFYHALLVGSHLQMRNYYQSLIWFLIITFAAIAIVRLFEWSGSLKIKYTLASKKVVAKDVIRYQWQPMSRRIAPAPGQFAYLQARRFGESHPFTVSHFDNTSGAFCQSIKAVGPFSETLGSLKIGHQVYVEGPFGIFTNELPGSPKPVVLIAGGIGITPFIRWLKAKKADYLFYGAQTEEDLAYKDDIKNSQARFVFVLSQQQKPGLQSGHITADLLKQKLGRAIPMYEYFVCGPPAMMTKIIGELQDNGVAKKQIHSERFSL